MNSLIFVGVAAFAAITFGGKPCGYLARIGPAPLRFQAPPKGPDYTVALPPLKMSEPPPELREVTTNETATLQQPVAITPPPAQPAVVPTEPAFTPQMLLQFFHQNSTNYDASVIVPYQFNPPSAPIIPAPPSKATYTKQ